MKNSSSPTDEARLQLEALEKKPRNAPLINLLDELLKKPKTQTLNHAHINSLCAVMNNEKPSLKEVIDYITQFELIRMPTMHIKGSFFCDKPLNNDHESCLSLLNTVARNFNDNNELWDAANTLLQSSLIIYKEVHFEEISLDDDKGIAKKTEDGSGCNVM